ncbi:MAG: sigma-54 dependent transcriptional regulator [Candidatus Latescibacterota bacterium]
MADKIHILLVSKDADLKAAAVDELEGASRHVIVSEGVHAAIGVLRRGGADLLIVDRPSQAEASGLYAELKRNRPEGMMLLVGSPGEQDFGSRSQADFYMEKPVDRARLREIADRVHAQRHFVEDSRLIGRSEGIQEIRAVIMQIAPTNVNVLIVGENGTGKEVVAQAIHRYSPRRDKPFVPVNCGAIPENLVESELFGHEKGAFTSAQNRREGLFEAADGGTLLLDEIGEMPPMAQVKLLRVLEEREIMRVGGRSVIPVDVRVLASSNRDLRQAVQQGNFREDLYFRLKVVEISVPPLRTRREDIPLLIALFSKAYCAENRIPPIRFSDDVMERLSSYSWPGNVRELKNVVESMIVLSGGRRIAASDVPVHLGERTQEGRHLPVLLGKTPDQSERELIYRALLELKADVAELKEVLLGRQSVATPVPYPLHDVDFTEESSEKGIRVSTMQDMERDLIRKTLDNMKGNRKKTARTLGIGERTLYRKLKKYGL